MGKVLIATFDDNDLDFDELTLFLKKKGYNVLTNTVSHEGVLRYDGLEINLKSRTVIVREEKVELTNYEFEILYLLAKNPGQVFPKEQIYNQVWKEPYYRAEDNVTSLIRRIRKKIELDPSKPIYILTVWGIGYKFNSAIKKK